MEKKSDLRLCLMEGKVTESKDFEVLTWKRERIPNQVLTSENYAT